MVILKKSTRPWPCEVIRSSCFKAVASQTMLVRVSRMTRNAFVTCRSMYRLKSVMTCFSRSPDWPLYRLPKTPWRRRQPAGTKWDSHQPKMAEFRRFGMACFPEIHDLGSRYIPCRCCKTAPGSARAPLSGALRSADLSPAARPIEWSLP